MATVVQPMSETQTPEKNQSHREGVAKLSRSALTGMLIAMFILPFAAVYTIWYLLPPVSEHQLQADIRIENLETAAQFNRLQRDSLVPEPRMVVTNTGDEEWTQIILEINKRYQVYRKDEKVKPGEQIISGLDYFSYKGSFFPPGRIPLRHVRVFARVPSGARATCELEFEAQDP